MIARMRGVRASYWQDGEVYDLEAASKLPIRVAFAALKNWTDREGRFEWNPRFLKLNLLPYDPVDMAQVLDVMASGNLIVPYEVGGKKYGWMPCFKEEQNINKNEAASECPAPPPEIVKRAEAGHLLAGFHTYRDEPASATVHASAGEGSGVNMSAYADSLEVKGSEVKGSEVKEDQERGPSSISSTAQEPVQQIEEVPGVSVVPTNGDRPQAWQVQPLPPIQGKRTYKAILGRLAELHQEIVEGGRRRIKKEQLHTVMSEMVFGYWAAKTNHERAIFDSSREKLLMKQLRDNDGDVSELFYAVDGCLKDEWMQGRAKRSTRKFDGIEDIFGDREKVERLAGTMKEYKDGKPHGMVKKYREVLSTGGDDDRMVHA